MAQSKAEKPVDGVVFRSVNPVFAFRYAPGRGAVGKAFFYSHEDTIITDPALVQRCRQYVPNFLIEGGTGLADAD